MSPQLSIINFRQGAYIIVEGKQQADYFFIIRSGTVSMTKEVQVVAEQENSILNPGDFFGVVSTMSSHSHIETARALVDVTLIMVHRDSYQLLIKQNPGVAMKIIEAFSRRMRYLDQSLAHLTLKKSTEPETEHLFEMATYYAKQSQYHVAYYVFYQYIKYCPEGSNIAEAKQQMTKLKPNSKAVYLESGQQEFTRAYPGDTMIFAESMPGQELYIIQKGNVKITKFVNGNEVLLAVLKQGDIFGEMSLIENKPRSASAIAFEDSVLLAVNRDNFKRMVTTQPQIIARITTLFSERIWFIYKQLANTMIKNNLGRLYDALWIQLEKERVMIRSDQPYQFNFGTRELINMVGLPLEEGNQAVRELFLNGKIKSLDNRILTSDVSDIQKQSEYFRKMQRIENARKEQRRGS